MIRLDAKLINDHSNLQEHYGTEFLLQWKKSRKIHDLDGETVMEIGCGPGNTSTKNLLCHFPSVGKIVATDVSEDMIQLARTQNSHPKVEYFVANAQDESFFRERFCTVDKVFSFFVLHWVKDQEQAFKNIFNVIRPGGEAALLMPLRADSFDATEQIKNYSKWKDVLKDVSDFVPLSHTKGFDALYYREMLSNIGFEVLLCKTQDNVYDHQTHERFKKSVCSICVLTKHVPESKKDEFGEDLLYLCKKLSNTNDSQNIFNFSCLSVFLRKPTTETL